MKKNMEKNYVKVDMDMIIISIYNSLMDEDGKICHNDEDFFEAEFNNKYDAAWAVSLSHAWAWSDDFVYLNGEGYLTSFNHWDDEKSPIDLDKLDISKLINSLKRQHKNRYVVNNIPKAIHDALEE